MVHGTSMDPDALLESGLRMANSDQPADHNELGQLIRTPDYLKRLDPEGRAVRLIRLLSALADNQSPTARRALIAVIQDPNFNDADERSIALLRASEVVRPPPPELLEFWDRHSQSEDGYSPTTITALVKNGSIPALRLFELKLVDPSHEDADKVTWMRSRVLSHRNDFELLRACNRLLAGVALANDLKRHLVDVLFDYRPAEWFRPATVPRVPARSGASSAALLALREVGETALKVVPLSKPQRHTVLAVLREVKEILGRRTD